MKEFVADHSSCFIIAGGFLQIVGTFILLDHVARIANKRKWDVRSFPKRVSERWKSFREKEKKQGKVYKRHVSGNVGIFGDVQNETNEIKILESEVEKLKKDFLNLSRKHDEDIQNVRLESSLIIDQQKTKESQEKELSYQFNFASFIFIVLGIILTTLGSVL